MFETILGWAVRAIAFVALYLLMCFIVVAVSWLWNWGAGHVAPTLTVGLQDFRLSLVAIILTLVIFFTPTS